MTRRSKSSIIPPKVGDIKIYPESDTIGKPVQCMVTKVYVRRKSQNRLFVGAYYDTGLIKGFVQEIHYNQEKNNDNVIVIDGDEGSGKSSFAVRLAYLLDPNHFDASFICYTMDELRECLGRCKGGETILMDESGNIVLNRDFAKKDNKDFVKLIQAIRVMRLNFLMVIPHMESLDLYIKEFRVKYWFHMITHHHGKERGFYRLWRPDPNREFSKGRFFEEIGCSTFRPLSEYPDMAKLVKDYENIKMRFVSQIITSNVEGRDNVKVYKEKYTHAMYCLYSLMVADNHPDPYAFLQEEFGLKYNTLADMTSINRRRWGNITFAVKGNIAGVKYKDPAAKLGRPLGSRNFGVCKIDELPAKQRELVLSDEQVRSWVAEHPGEGLTKDMINKAVYRRGGRTRKAKAEAKKKEMENEENCSDYEDGTIEGED